MRPRSAGQRSDPKLVVYAYYHRLNSRQKSIYRSSDNVESLALNDGESLMPITAQLASALAHEDQKKTTRLCRALVDGICIDLEVRATRIKVLARRPSNDYGELHGLYEPGKSPQITVWMRTAQRKQVVAFKTFLRTVLHELCHHLDYEFLKLEDSFHTEGFFKRESSLYKQLVRID